MRKREECFVRNSLVNSGRPSIFLFYTFWEVSRTRELFTRRAHILYIIMCLYLEVAKVNTLIINVNISENKSTSVQLRTRRMRAASQGT